ncbi:hypothetical protein TIFTF001_023571 [Ficus carica]|uniref:Uncharacterized protein n=1 Tax=Ficus carica TaxID=3494 RepID=A0AA88B053_FICCA|nr:hypothetical protein TIFTF001_023571 [Ficus carica]
MFGRSFGASSRRVTRLLTLKFSLWTRLDVSFLVMVAVWSGASIEVNITCLGVIIETMLSACVSIRLLKDVVV